MPSSEQVSPATRQRPLEASELAWMVCVSSSRHSALPASRSAYLAIITGVREGDPGRGGRQGTRP
eukprot:6962230-Pyramimonas_sp.AAC.1